MSHDGSEVVVLPDKPGGGDLGGERRQRVRDGLGAVMLHERVAGEEDTVAWLTGAGHEQGMVRASLRGKARELAIPNEKHARWAPLRKVNHATTKEHHGCPRWGVDDLQPSPQRSERVAALPPLKAVDEEVARAPRIVTFGDPRQRVLRVLETKGNKERTATGGSVRDDAERSNAVGRVQRNSHEDRVRGDAAGPYSRSRG